jgi:hypothetical protein
MWELLGYNLVYWVDSNKKKSIQYWRIKLNKNSILKDKIKKKLKKQGQKKLNGLNQPILF